MANGKPPEPMAPIRLPRRWTRGVTIHRPGDPGHPGGNRKVYVRVNFRRCRKTRTFHTLPVAQEYADKAWAALYALEYGRQSPESLVRHMATYIPKAALHRATGERAFFTLVDLYAMERARLRFLDAATARRDKRRLVAKTQREAFFAVLGRRCGSCGTIHDLTFDHIQPWSLGGKTELANSRVLCRPCNSRRGNRVSAEPETPGTVRAQ